MRRRGAIPPPSAALTITPAAALGGRLWKFGPQAPFINAGVIGIVGTIVFAAIIEERYAG